MKKQKLDFEIGVKHPHTPLYPEEEKNVYCSVRTDKLKEKRQENGMIFYLFRLSDFIFYKGKLNRASILVIYLSIFRYSSKTPLRNTTYMHLKQERKTFTSCCPKENQQKKPKKINK